MNIQARLTSVCMLLAFCAVAHAETWHVPAGGNIQAAIDQAENGDVIQLEAGVYEPEATLQVNALDITIRGVLDSDSGQPLSILDGRDEIQLIHADKSTLEIDAVVIENGLALDNSTNGVQAYGAAIHAENGVLSIRSSAIRHCHCLVSERSQGSGSSPSIATGVVWTNNTNVSIFDSRFESNRLENRNLTQQYRGAYGTLSIGGATFTAERCIFLDNMYWSNNDSAIGIDVYVPGSQTITCLADCFFERSNPDGANAFPALYLSGAREKIIAERCHFSDNRGGAVMLYQSGSPNDPSIMELKDCQFARNYTFSDSLGGAITIRSYSNSGSSESAIFISNCVFEDNSASNSNGGAVSIGRNGAYDELSGHLAIYNCVFTGNLATNGGAISLRQVSMSRGLSVLSCDFTANHATANGGAVHLEAGAPCTIADSRFMANTADVNGGAIDFLDLYDRLAILRTSFEENSALYGGAIACSAIYNDVCGSMHVNACEFLRNGTNSNGLCYDGGGILLEQSACTIRGSDFLANSASRGGAIQANLMCFAGGIQPTIISGSTFRDNTSDYSLPWWGVIHVDDAPVEVSSSDFCGNYPRDADDGALISLSDDCVLDACSDFGDTWTVCARGCDFSTIQAAIDAAGTGDVVEVAPGHEETEVHLRGKRLRLQCAAETLDGRARIGTLHYSGAESTKTILSGFTINRFEDGLGEDWPGVALADCTITRPTDSPNSNDLFFRADTGLVQCDRCVIGPIGDTSKRAPLFLRDCQIAMQPDTQLINGLGSPAIFRRCDFATSHSGHVLRNGTWILRVLEECVVDVCDTEFPEHLTIIGAGNIIPECCPTCREDLDCDGMVRASDMGIMFSAWGSSDAQADLNGDGIVSGPDLGVLFLAWGECVP